MRFIPIVHRELLIAGRRGMTYLGRLIAVGVMSAIMMWILFAAAGQSPANVGQAVFITIAAITYLLCALTGVRLTSDSLSYERREGTLGLLFLTNLRGIEIILGKLAAGGIQAVLTLTATFPLFAVPFLFGGITASDFLWFVVSALNVLFLSLTLGLLASALCKDDRVALGAGVLLMGGVVFGPLLAALVHGQLSRAGSGAEFLAGFSPATAPFLLLAERVGGIRGAMPPGLSAIITQSMWTTLVGALAAVALAAIFLSRYWRVQEGQTTPRSRSGQRLSNPLESHAEARLRSGGRAPLLDLNPYLWLASRNRAGRYAPWGVLVAAALMWVGGLGVWGGEFANEGLFMVTAFLIHLALKLLIAGVACWQFNEDRGTGAMELILSTPLTVGDILKGQRQALMRMFLGPILLVLVLDFLLLLVHVNKDYSGGGTVVLLYLAGMAALVVDAFALRSMGMWLGLRMRRTNVAVTRTVVCILALPWAVMLVTVSLVALLPFGLFPSLEAEMVILYWLALSVGNALIWRGWAERNLAKQFRAEATGRFDAKRGWKDFFKATISPSAAPPPLPPS